VCPEVVVRSTIVIQIVAVCGRACVLGNVTLV